MERTGTEDRAERLFPREGGVGGERRNGELMTGSGGERMGGERTSCCVSYSCGKLMPCRSERIGNFITDVSNIQYVDMNWVVFLFFFWPARLFCKVKLLEETAVVIVFPWCRNIFLFFANNRNIQAETGSTSTSTLKLLQVFYWLPSSP